MVLEFLFIIYLAISRICDPLERYYLFSKCLNGTMSAMFYWNATDCENNVTSPIFNINCSGECPPGRYLGITDLNEPDCLECPKNTYSSGNILRFSDNEKNFNQANDFFETHCKWIDAYGKIHRDEGCTSWHSSKDNTTFQIGHQNNESYIKYQALIHPNFTREGNIIFRYKKNFPKNVASTSDCALIFGIDGEIVDSDSNFQDRLWIYKAFLLKPGLHEIYFGLHITSKIENVEDLVSINLIEIFGIFHPTFECTPCKFGFSAPGSSFCSRCDANQYIKSFQDSECLNCGEGTFSAPGSIGSQSCVAKPECSIYDFYNETKCNEGTKSINLLPIPANSFCTENGQRPSQLSFPCGQCNPGYFGSEGICKKCTSGHYSNGTFSCRICPTNTYSTSVIFLKYLEEIPEFIKTYCINHDPYIDACQFYYSGWKLINNSFVTTSNLLNLATINLEIKVNIFSDDGQFEFLYESTCDMNSILLVKIKSNLFNIDLNQSGSFIMPLEKNNQTVLISFYSLSTLSSCIVKINNIKISGAMNGAGDSCNLCPDGYFSSQGSLFCRSCNEGYARLKGQKCIECPQNYYRDRNMDECQKCPAHTIPNKARTGCILYDSYEILDNYMFNIFKFDVNEDFSKYSSAKDSSTGGFFGPIFFDEKKSILYLSPTATRKLSTTFYEFEEEFDLRNENSYIFALLHMNVTEKGIYAQKNTYSGANSSHYRVLRSFGSEIGKVNFTQVENILATVTYVNGDKCHDDPTLNYSSTINFVCDKSKNHFSPKILNFKNCHMNILWESPFVCSECKYNETSKFSTSCIDGKRYTYLEEGSNCIIIFGLNGTFNIEKVDQTSLFNNYMINFSLSEQNAKEEDLNKQGFKFAYYDTIIASCNEVRISFIIVLIFLCACLLAVIVALICAFTARKYKWNYFSLKDETEKLRLSPGPIMPGGTVKPFNLDLKELSEKNQN